MQLDVLSSRIDRMETYSRRNTILFHGIPEENDEDIEAKLLNILSEQMKLRHINGNCIEYCHRLGSTKDQRARPVLVRFESLRARSNVWNTKTSLKGSKISVSEFLTKSRQQVFTEARKYFGIRNCWSSDGTIVVMLLNN
ncbi:hypothetical protein ACJJTC_013919 [Scirpophaga incertulas]